MSGQEEKIASQQDTILPLKKNPHWRLDMADGGDSETSEPEEHNVFYWITKLCGCCCGAYESVD